MMAFNQRRALRLAFAGVVELSVADQSKHLIAAATKLSLFGCFVKTTVDFSAGCKVNVRITYDGDEFTASGEVIHVLPEKGIGIAFDQLTPRNQAMLEFWLSEPEQIKNIAPQNAPRIRMAFLDDFPVELTCPECQSKALTKISVLKGTKAYRFPCGHNWRTERFAVNIAVAERELESVLRRMAEPGGLE